MMRPAVVAVLLSTAACSTAGDPPQSPGANPAARTGNPPGAADQPATRFELPADDPVDHHSCARPGEVHTVHLDLDLALDFAAHRASGTATHTLFRTDPQAPLWLDTDGLEIETVADERGQRLPYALGAADPHLGQPLRIDLGPDTKQVVVRYRTAADAEAMQWLQPEQTNGGTKPFLFTQGQAILTRSWIPLQDSPAVRITWSASVQAPADLEVVMSASARGGGNGTGRTTFRMTEAVPPYLIALACGDLQRRELSPRCAVWAEPALVDAAAQEFADLEAMVAACERLFGPYRWGRYDVLVLPPSFPFGGMENPCLTFATPTILAGDKSLVSLLAHELAHSWSGNLVTNATWRDFWLNEGFTVYLENRIMEQVFGAGRAAMEIVLGMGELRAELAELPAQDQVLHVDLQGRNPDDGMTQVPYQKGAALLRRLEQLFGRDRLDAFLRSWFDGHAFTSVTTRTFVEFLQRELLARDPAAASQLDLGRWLSAPGLPADAPESQSELFAAVDQALVQFAADQDARALPAQAWVTQQWLRFLAGLREPSLGQLAALDAAWQLTRSTNNEVLCAWLCLAARHGYRPADRRIELFLTTVGRRKFVKPLFEALLARPDGRVQALSIYRKARPRYHAVTVRTLDSLLGWQATDR
ncbi:MAG: M1 family metallopeptidase [Planctomycetes bacterium]|nr:M1 family metallopeptidase [Planctomycetota bacterium]